MVDTSIRGADVETSPREVGRQRPRARHRGCDRGPHGHAYVLDLAAWYYDDELAAGGIWSVVLTPAAGFGALVALGPLFFLAGWFSV